MGGGARGTLRCRTPGAGFPTSGCHRLSPALAASGDVTSPAGLPRGSLSPGSVRTAPRRGRPGGWGLGTLGRTPALRSRISPLSWWREWEEGDAGLFGVSPAPATHSPCDLRQVTAPPFGVHRDTETLACLNPTAGPHIRGCTNLLGCVRLAVTVG